MQKRFRSVVLSGNDNNKLSGKEIKKMNDYLIPRNGFAFEKAFPELENINIKVTFLRGGGRTERTEIFTNNNFPSKGISCINRVCMNGGLSESTIPIFIKEMISQNKMEIEKHEFCKGGLYNRGKRYNDCGWSFSLEITIKYKQDS